MTIGDRMKKRRIELKLVQEDVALVVGVTKQTIQKYENNIITNIPSDKIELIAKALNTSPSYLMGWDDEEFDVFSIPGIIPIPKMKKVPRLGTIACGEPILADENLNGYDDIDFDIDCDFSLECQGDSMINARILDGDIVYIKQMPMVNNGEIAAVMVDNEVTLKRVFLSNNKLVLQPENPQYSPMVYVNEELNNIRILGKAVYFKSIVK